LRQQQSGAGRSVWRLHRMRNEPGLQLRNHLVRPSQGRSCNWKSLRSATRPRNMRAS
jgi:hypothetical protein